MFSVLKRWQPASRISADADNDLQDYPPVFRQILYNRGCGTKEAARQFLEAKLSQSSDPSLLSGLPESVDRILWAVQKQEPISVYGDYDADGVTATALLVQVLRSMGGAVSEYIPNRFDEGYGLNIEALNNLHERGIRLVITVDCGIRSLSEAEHARSLGIDLIISDHHHPSEELPPAFSIVNPKQPGDAYPDKDLAGVGIAYKLAEGLVKRSTDGINTNQVNLEDSLDLVAIGTISDLAPLVGENRSLVKAGLTKIRHPYRQGIMALMSVSGLTPGRVKSTDIGYTLGPRLNAAGRLESALDAYRLLTTDDVAEAGYLAQKLDDQNRIRQEITRQIQKQSEEIAMAEDPNSMLIFTAHPDFNPGVVGLAATRLSELYYRPVIIAHQGESFTRGSGRSIPEFHITDALDKCADLLEHHGGHAAAAGFTVRTDKLAELKERLSQIANEQLQNRDLRPILTPDAEVTLSELQPELIDYLDWLQPTGYGNRDASFLTRDVRVVRSRPVGKDNAHLKFTVSDGWINYDAIAFRQGYWYDRLPLMVDLVFAFEMNEYNGMRSLQLNVRDLKPSGYND